ncbi:MAG: Xaa-Pro aminopeptidase [Pseudomonadales bacterium]|nr:Xaa-Pro aminopeptidase [Pseudomonadales bacterium]
MKISKQEFARRRRELMQQMGKNAIAILPAATEQMRNRDVDFPFRQDSDFHYLSGFNEPESVLVLIPGRKHGEVVMFCRERDREMETWHGYRSGPEGAIKDFGADDAFPISDIDDILPGLIEGRERLYYAMGCRPDFDAQVMDWVNGIRQQVRSGAHPPGEFVSLDHLLHDLRLIKSKAELKVMQEAGTASAEGHRRAMEKVKPGMMEYQLEAEYLHEFMRRGCRSTAYPSIVGGGENACILHYTENDKPLQDGDLVLVDAGGEYEYYAGDITRTFPVNGKFTEAQKDIYNVVLKSQLAAIAAVKLGNNWNQPHEVAVKVLTKGLVELGLLKGRVSTLIKEGAYRKYYMHRTGHWIGMDVHDVGDYKIDDQWRVLEPGMVLTVEPGLYIAPDCKSAPKKYRGIGVRIEDDVVVTKGEALVLTRAAPKTVADIERLMAKGKKKTEEKAKENKPAAKSKRVVSKKLVDKKTANNKTVNAKKVTKKKIVKK